MTEPSRLEHRPWEQRWSQWWRWSVPGQLSGILTPWGSHSSLVLWLEPLGLFLTCTYWVLSSQSGTGLLGLVLVGMAATLVGLWLTHPPLSPLLPSQGWLLLFWGIATLATLLSPVRYAATEGWLKLTLYLLGFVLLHRLLQHPFYRQVLVGVLLLVSLAMGVIGLRQYFFGAADLATWVDPESGLTGVTRVYSSLKNPNLYAGFLVPLLPLGVMAVWIWKGWGLKILAVGITVINLLCLGLSLSRGAWIGALIALAVTTFMLLQWNQLYVPARWRRWLIPVFFGGGLIVLLIAVLLIEPLQLRVLSIFAGRNDSSNNFRINVWLSSLQMLHDFPWLGIGPGNSAFNRVYPLYQNPQYSALGAYSVPLELALEVGIPGALLYGLFVVAVGRLGWQSWLQCLRERQSEGLWAAAGLAAMAGMIGHACVDTVWYRPQVQMLWWLSVALVTASGAQLGATPAQKDKG